MGAIDDYIAPFPAPVRRLLKQMRRTIREDDELSIYKSGKGSVQFPLDQPLPLDLVRRVVRFRLDQSRTNATRDTRAPAGARARTTRPRKA